MSDQLVWDSKPHDMPRTVTSLTRNAHSLAMSESGELSSNAFINNLLQQWVTIIGMSNKESQLVSYSSKSGRITGWLENKKKNKNLNTRISNSYTLVGQRLSNLPKNFPIFFFTLGWPKVALFLESATKRPTTFGPNKNS